jgi:hypothetical protein
MYKIALLIGIGIGVLAHKLHREWNSYIDTICDGINDFE